MNCPQCFQAVGEDRFAYEPWQELFQGDVVIGGTRHLYIHCSHCGTFTVREFIERGYKSIDRIIRHRSPAAIRRVERKLPALNLQEAAC